MAFCRQVDLTSIVCPRAELHATVLIVEGEPLDVDGAGRDVEAQRDPRTVSVMVDHDVSIELAVDVLIGAK